MPALNSPLSGHHQILQNCIKKIFTYIFVRKPRCCRFFFHSHRAHQINLHCSISLFRFDKYTVQKSPSGTCPAHGPLFANPQKSHSSTIIFQREVFDVGGNEVAGNWHPCVAGPGRRIPCAGSSSTGIGQNRGVALLERHHGHFRGISARRGVDGGRRNQRWRRRAGQADRARGRRPGLRLGSVCRESQGIAARARGRFGFRLLDLGVAQIRAAGFRRAQRPALLPRAVRRRGMLPQYYLHRGDAEPAVDTGCQLPDERGWRRLQKVLSAGHRLRIPAHGQQDPAGLFAGPGSAGRKYHGRVHPLPPPGLPDHRPENQEVRRRWQRLRTEYDQR